MRYLIALVLFALPVAGCFNVDDRPCVYACGPGGACPDDYKCLGDGYCHLHGNPTICSFSDAAINADAAMSMGGDLSAETSTDMSMPGTAATDLASVDLATPAASPSPSPSPSPTDVDMM